MKENIEKLTNWLLHLPMLIKILILLVILGGGWFVYKSVATNSSKVTYQTSSVTKGTLMTTISASGTITSGDTTYITTGASGTVSKVYVKNGDTVTKGQKLADLSLDDSGRETQVTAWNNYQETLVKIKEAQTAKQTLEITMLKKKQALADAETAQRDGHSGGWNPATKQPYTASELLIVEKQYPEARLAYNAAIQDFQIADTNISLAYAKSTAAYRSYQQVSSSIYAPASGILNNLVLAEGVVIGSSSTSSITVSSGTDTSTNSVSVSSQKIGAIKNPNGQYQSTVSLTEVDVTTVKSGQKVTLTLDAYPDKSLTGTVLAVNTSGSVSSNVTSYSATILLDKTTLELYTNMAVSTTIITSSKNDVLLVPSTAIQTAGDKTTVTVKKDNTYSAVSVVTGNSNDTETEITSGLNEGDVVVTATINSTSSTKKSSSSTKSSSGSSLFGGSSMGGGMPGGPGL